ncbi:MAG: archaetidylserine decarboxylase [Gammaproteobacteria bacterium]|nr:archaetidylserine decarboxylase [Gammaproteobacteria bacterium]MDP2139508.1 archaetidylserine decarboxylase [Gammaproteobacteria bacterium]MDP2348463.1 archaetidylserine decarboxylase [Gammaproteobacteria bacterium]
MKGRVFLVFQHIVPQHALSRVIGWLANCRWAIVKNTFIGWFVKRYRVDMLEACCSDPLQFKNFNEFFTRELKAGARVVDDSPEAIVSPADGAISQSGAITQGALLQAKGRHFSLVNLLGGDIERAEPFQEGCFATVYLSPRDYHRVHMPVTGTLTKMIHVPGKLFSVNQLTSENVPDLFARNERVVCLFDTDFGPMALVLVGAMIVAGVETVWAGQVCPGRTACAEVSYHDHSPPIQILKGEEMGRFKLGSTVIVVFGPGIAALEDSLCAGDPVRMGQRLGTLLAINPDTSSSNL